MCFLYDKTYVHPDCVVEKSILIPSQITRHFSAFWGNSYLGWRYSLLFSQYDHSHQSTPLPDHSPDTSPRVIVGSACSRCCYRCGEYSFYWTASIMAWGTGSLCTLDHPVAPDIFARPRTRGSSRAHAPTPRTWYTYGSTRCSTLSLCTPPESLLHLDLGILDDSVGGLVSGIWCGSWGHHPRSCRHLQYLAHACARPQLETPASSGVSRDHPGGDSCRYNSCIFWRRSVVSCIAGIVFFCKNLRLARDLPHPKTRISHRAKVGLYPVWIHLRSARRR